MVDASSIEDKGVSGFVAVLSRMAAALPRGRGLCRFGRDGRCVD